MHACDLVDVFILSCLHKLLFVFAVGLTLLFALTVSGETLLDMEMSRPWGCDM